MPWADRRSPRARCRSSSAAPGRDALLALVVVAAGAGCGRYPLAPSAGPSGAAGAPDDSSLSTPTGFCRAFEASSYAATKRCYGSEVPADVVATIDAQICAPLDGALAAGRITYDRAGAAACLSQAGASLAESCRFDTIPCADEVVAGLLPDGAPCESSAECAATSFCVRPDRSTCQQAVCTPDSQLGEPCGIGCAPGLTCATDGSDVCVVDTGTLGAGCDLTAVAPCDWGFACRPNASGAGACVESRTGLACQDDLECPVEDLCDGTCKPRLAMGASCAASPQGCLALATCDQATRRCVPAGNDGQPCGMNGFCYEGSCSPTAAGDSVCVVNRGTGSACDDPNECASGVCEAGACAACAP
ncbi:MAG TPA: hypothetical protein VHL80_14095 [Polyangia bacterium]|nr:hypothetical protein [Polyangia bacterium]